MKIAALILIALTFITANIAAQAPDTAWTRLYHRGSYDECKWIEETSDDGFALVGVSQILGNNYLDIFLIRTDQNGDTLWTHTYGDTIIGQDAKCVKQDDDSGFVIAGTKDLSMVLHNAYIIKTNSNGDTVWSYFYGGDRNADANYIDLTSDDGYIITGRKYVPGNFADMFLLKLDSDGDYEWDMTYGDGYYQEGVYVKETPDSGFVLAGQSNTSGDMYDYYLIKTDDDGDIIWGETYGGASNDICHGAKVTSDGGCIMFGESDSYIPNSSLAVKVDSSGDTLWTRVCNRSNGDYGFSVEQTSDGGYIFGGYSNNPGFRDDYWFTRTDANGDTLWMKTVGHGDDQRAYCVLQSSDGGYVLAGGSSEGVGPGGDFFVVKLNPDPTDIEDDYTVPSGFALKHIFPNPFNASTMICYTLAERSRVKLDIYNLLGQHVNTLFDDIRQAGEHSIIWDASEYSSGLYFARLTSSGRTEAIKMLLMK